MPYRDASGDAKTIMENEVYVPVSYTHLDVYKRQSLDRDARYSE